MTGRTIVDALLEAVEAGTLFIDTSSKGFLPEPGVIFAPTTMREAAAKEFVTSWSHVMQAAAKVRILRYKPVDVVDSLIKTHGLVAIIKKTGTISGAANPSQKFIYACTVQRPPFSSSQVAKIHELFSPTPSDVWHRVECLSNCNTPVDQATTARILGPKGRP